METKLEIGILIICTGKYDIFLQPLIESIDTHFFPGDNITIFLFGDKEEYALRMSPRVSVVVIPTKHMPWPASTLYRYRYFTNASEKISTTDYVAYCDVDMRMVGDITREVLIKDGKKANIIVTRHPGFYNNSNWGSQNIHRGSTAFLEDNEKERYVAGGFNLGKTESFLKMSSILADNIDVDYKNGIICEHNDESHTNFFVNKLVKNIFPDWIIKDLTPSYCMLPAMDARCAFGLQDLPAIILCLDKDHDSLR